MYRQEWSKARYSTGEPTPCGHAKQEPDLGGGGEGGHDTPVPLVKTSHKKMASTVGPLYFMFVVPPLWQSWIHYCQILRPVHWVLIWLLNDKFVLQFSVNVIADPETSEGRPRNMNISRRVRWPSFFGLFLQARGGMAPLAPPRSATETVPNLQLIYNLQRKRKKSTIWSR